MKHYVITRSMSRKDCSELMKRIDDDFRRTEKFSRLVKDLNSKHKENRKSRFRGNKKGSRDFVYSQTIYKGIKIYGFKSSKRHYGIIYNASPVDAPFVQFIIRGYGGHITFVTQHLLDRYRERIVKKEISSYKELMIDFVVKTFDINGDHIAIDGETGKLILRFNEGFVFGTEYEDYSVYNTVYDSSENKDTALKDRARNLKKDWDTLNDEQKRLYCNYLDEGEDEEISPSEFFRVMNKIFGDV